MGVRIDNKKRVKRFKKKFLYPQCVICLRQGRIYYGKCSKTEDALYHRHTLPCV